MVFMPFQFQNRPYGKRLDPVVSLGKVPLGHLVLDQELPRSTTGLTL